MHRYKADTPLWFCSKKNHVQEKAATPLRFWCLNKTCSKKKRSHRYGKEKSCSKKSCHTAEVLVFEQNKLKKKRSHRYGFVSEKKHVERTHNHPRNMFVWYKRMHQNKKRPHR